MPEANCADIADIEAVHQQFELWRQTRASKLEPIPDPLWQAAVKLCRSYPVTRVSRRLRLSFSELKKRLVPPVAPGPRFLEIDPVRLTDNWRIECDRSDGARLRVSGSGPAPNMDAVLARFLS